MLKSVEHGMVELKARIPDLNAVRKKLIELGAQAVGTFHQVDTYFEIPKGRLKLRETEGEYTAQLIYYERKNVAGPKESEVFILEVPKPAVFKAALKKVVKTKVTVDKMREIFRYEGTQIHLDTVEKLGTFIEFERVVSGSDAYATSEGQRTLEKLMKKLGVAPESLEKVSYSDLIAAR